MIRIFQTIKDLHSIYITPRELRGTTALIPFSFREFFDDRERPKFIVTDVGIGATFRNPLFKKGVEIVSWNGVPIDETVRKSGARSYGNNADSQLMAGIRRLTTRALFRDLLPESETVTVGFVAEGNRTESVTIPWIFIRMSSGVMAMITMNGAQFPDQAANSTIRQLAEKMLLTKKGRICANGTVQNIPVRADAALDIAGKIVTTSSGSFGIISFFGFSSTRSPGLLAAFDRLLLTQVPKNGVVIDVRQNEGGNVQLCQEVVPRFSTRFNIPVTLSLRVTRFLLEAARGVFGTVLGISRDDITRSRQFGNAFFFKQLFAQDQINSYTGPRYPGPVIVLTDAEAYSCGDIFVSNVKDNRAAFIVGIHNSTGGGGSTVSNTDQLRLFGFPIPQLHGVTMTTSVLRVDRARDQSGVPIEFFGITPNFLYRPTKRDRIEKDHDLYKFLADRLERLR